MLTVQAVPVLLHPACTRSEADGDSPARELIEIAGLRCKHERSATERIRDRAAQPDLRGRLGHRSQSDRGRPIVELCRPHRREARLLGQLGGLTQLRRAAIARHKRDAGRDHSSGVLDRASEVPVRQTATPGVLTSCPSGTRSGVVNSRTRCAKYLAEAPAEVVG